MNIEASYNFRRVDEKLTTSGAVSAAALGALRTQGYEVIVNLLPDSNQHAVPGERELVESQGLEYIHIPVDFNQPTHANFEQFAAAMDRVRGKQIHVHCAANWRVTAFYALYAVRRGDWTAGQAMEFMHDVWQPAEYPGWPELIAEVLRVA